MLFSLETTSHGPGPRTAIRNAHNVIRNRDQALCVYSFLPQLIPPGGKWTRRLHEFLGQRGCQEPRQHPAFGCRTLSRRKSVEVKQRFQSLEQQLDLPTQAVQFQDSQSRRLSVGKGCQNPDDIAISSSTCDDTSGNPSYGLRKTPALVRPGTLFWGYWNNNIELYCPRFRNFVFPLQHENALPIPIAYPQIVRVQARHYMSIVPPHRINTACGRIGAIPKNHLAFNCGMPSIPFAAAIVSQFNELEASCCCVDQNVSAPFCARCSRPVNHRRVDRPKAHACWGLAYLVLQRLRQYPFQPGFSLSQSVEQPWPRYFCDFQGACPSRHILQREIRNCVSKCHSNQGCSVWDIATSKEGIGLLGRILHVCWKQCQNVRPLAIIVNRRSNHKSRLAQKLLSRNPYFNAYGDSTPAPLGDRGCCLSMRPDKASSFRGTL